MTSIHASVPSSLREATAAAKARGEDQTISNQKLRGEQLAAKKQHQQSFRDSRQQIEDPILHTGPHPECVALKNNTESKGQCGNVFGSNENEPACGFGQITARSPDKKITAKRPLSDRSCQEEGITFDHSLNVSSLVNEQTLGFPAAALKASSAMPTESSLLKVAHDSVRATSCEKRAMSVLDLETGENTNAIKRTCSGEAGWTMQARSNQPQCCDTLVGVSLAAPTATEGQYTSRVSSSTVAFRGARAGRPRVGLRRL